jgi:hypothetical protein
MSPPNRPVTTLWDIIRFALAMYHNPIRHRKRIGEILSDLGSLFPSNPLAVASNEALTLQVETYYEYGLKVRTNDEVKK